MKKVRFVSPTKVFSSCSMNEFDCHFPRPMLEKQTHEQNPYKEAYKTVVFSTDPVHRFEYSNAFPNPVALRADLLSEVGTNYYPTNELELTMLDSSTHESRKAKCGEPTLKFPESKKFTESCVESPSPATMFGPCTSTDGNEELSVPRNIKDNSFFIKRDSMSMLHPQLHSLQQQIKLLQVDKENVINVKKTNFIQKGVLNENVVKDKRESTSCPCHHCKKRPPLSCLSHGRIFQQQCHSEIPVCSCSHERFYHECFQEAMQPNQCKQKTCRCNNTSNSESVNAVEKKMWAVQKYENSKKSSNMEMEKQANVSKEKREPTVADLFKIIKLQNEQLQLLQEKVDKFISTSNPVPAPQPVQNFVTKCVSAETVSSKDNKMSIGVMTSFEVVHTSTIINKEIIKTKENAQIQCNQSQISIKEIVSKTQPVNVNFLDGLRPADSEKNKNYYETKAKDVPSCRKNGDQAFEEKTLNEQSLFNVQVDNATTPLMSPDQTLYLDVRDYSDSDSGSDHSNIGWTYYNKVMTHVNGMLQDSDIPSSASALWRNTRQQCMQMQIDKTNVSVMKRVKFGEDVFVTKAPVVQIPQNNAVPCTDTSLKMKQLAAKYLKSVPSTILIEPAYQPTATNEMSTATRNYMERHQIIQGSASKPVYSEMPRFLDITALKQQPKFL